VKTRHPECTTCPHWHLCQTGAYIGKRKSPIVSVMVAIEYAECTDHITHVYLTERQIEVKRETGDFHRKAIPEKVAAAFKSLDHELRSIAGVPQEGTYGPVQCPRDARRAAGSGDGSAGNQLES
jgi:hypothetical protein